MTFPSDGSPAPAGAIADTHTPRALLGIDVELPDGTTVTCRPLTLTAVDQRSRGAEQRWSQSDERPQEIRITIVHERGETTDELRYRLNRRGALGGVLIPNTRR